MPAPVPSPPAQRTRAPSSASRARSVVEQPRPRAARAGCSSAASSSRERGLDVVAPERGGDVGAPRAAARRSTLTPMPSTAQSRRARLDEDAGDLAAVEQHVVGPLDARRRAGDVGDREPGAQRQQVVEARAGRASAAIAVPGGVTQRAALAAAAAVCSRRGDERAVRRARRRRARARASFVEPIAAVGAGAGGPSGHAEPQLVAGRDAEQRRGAAAVDGERERRRRSPRRAAARRAATSPNVAARGDRRAARRVDARSPSSRGVASSRHVAERVDLHDVRRAASAVAARAQLEPDERRRVDRRAARRARRSARCAATGREDVAAVERGRDRLEPPRRVADLDRLGDAAEALRGRRSAARCRARRAAVAARSQRDARAAGRRRPGSTTARCTPAGVNGSARASRRAPVRTSCGGTPWPRSMTRASGRDPRDHAVHDARRTRRPARSRRGT